MEASDTTTTGTEPDQSESTRSVDPVAAVVSAMESLDTVPLPDHVTVFEQAHEQLRRALDVRPGA